MKARNLIVIAVLIGLGLSIVGVALAGQGGHHRQVMPPYHPIVSPTPRIEATPRIPPTPTPGGCFVWIGQRFVWVVPCPYSQ